MEEFEPKYRDKFLPLYSNGKAEVFGYTASRWCDNRIFFMTQSGWMGIGHQEMRTRDHVAILHGGKIPYVLRLNSTQQGDIALEDPPEIPRFEFIGECYVHGIMYGEFYESLIADRTWYTSREISTSLTRRSYYIRWQSLKNFIRPQLPSNHSSFKRVAADGRWSGSIFNTPSTNAPSSSLIPSSRIIHRHSQYC